VLHPYEARYTGATLISMKDKQINTRAINIVLRSFIPLSWDGEAQEGGVTAVRAWGSANRGQKDDVSRATAKRFGAPKILDPKLRPEDFRMRTTELWKMRTKGLRADSVCATVSRLEWRSAAVFGIHPAGSTFGRVVTRTPVHSRSVRTTGIRPSVWGLSEEDSWQRFDSSTDGIGGRSWGQSVA